MPDKNSIMNSENDSVKFIKWAVDLGCPLEYLPNEEYLKRIFRSNQNEKLNDMMKKIRPRSDVKHIRDNIIINKIRKVDGQINTLMISSLPPALQRYIQIENLKTQIEKSKKSVKQIKFQIENLSKSLENENRDYIQTKQNLDLSIQRKFVTENKNDFCFKYLKSLKEKKLTVDEIFSYNKQVIGNDGDHQNIENEKLLIQQCMEYLYDNNMEQYDQTVINQLKQSLNSITNINKWDLLNTLSNDQIKLIKNLIDQSKLKNENFRYTVLISKLYAEHIKIELKLKKTNLDCLQFDNMFETQFNIAEKMITKKFEMFNSSILSLDETINRAEFLLNFIEVVITKYINLDKIEFINSHIDIINNEIEQYENVHSENQNYIQTFDLIYNNIMKSIETIKKNSICIASTNGKLEYSKKLADNLMNEIFKNNNFRKMLINEKCLTTMAMESFYDESLLCSTKIGGDLDNMSRMEVTMMPSNQNVNFNFMQSLLVEYQLFNKLRFIRNYCVPTKSSTLILSNQILNHSTNEIFKKMFRNHLNTAAGVFECVTKKLELHDLLKHYTSKQFDFEMPFDKKYKDEIDKIKIEVNLSVQQENLKTIKNHIDGLVANINLKLDQNDSIINVLLDNDFKKYVSATETINGHTYKQLENELKIYSQI